MAQDALNNNLLSVAKNGELEQVNALILQGADVNAVDEKNDTPLNHAIRIGNFEIVEALLNANANVNSPNKNGDTPLCIASSFGIIDGKTARLEIIQALINKGAEVDLANQNDGMNPLHIATQNGEVKIVELLINNQAKIDMLNKAGITPLILAIANKKTEVALSLIENGADLKLADKDNWGPLQYAACKANTKVVEALIKKGVNEENPKLNPIQIAFISYLASNRTILPDDAASLEIVNKNFDELVKALIKGKADANLDIDFFRNILETIKKHGMLLDDNEKEVAKFLGEQLKKTNQEAAAKALLMLDDVGNAKGGGEQNAGSSTSPAISTAEMVSKLLAMADLTISRSRAVLNARGGGEQNEGPSRPATSTGKRGNEEEQGGGSLKRNTDDKGK